MVKILDAFQIMFKSQSNECYFMEENLQYIFIFIFYFFPFVSIPAVKCERIIR